MWIYILLFLFTVMFAYFSHFFFKTQKNTTAFLFLSLAIILPSIIAGCRDLNIGTDVYVYLVPAFQEAEASISLDDFLESSRLELFFNILVYVFAHYVGDIHWLLFTIQLIMMVLLAMIAYNYRKNIPIWFIFLFFMFFMYQLSFNMMRQSIALMICLYSFKYVENRKLLKFIVCICIAMGFHVTAFIFSITYFFYYLYCFSKETKWIHLFQVVLVVLSLSFILLYNELVIVSIYLGVLDPKYIQYTSFGDLFESSFSITDLGLRIVLFLFALYNFKVNLLPRKISSFFLFIAFFELICNSVSIYSAYASRIALYFFMLYFIFLPKIIFNSKNKIFFLLSIFIVLSYYWYYLYIVIGVSETYPYTSEILGIN